MIIMFISIRQFFARRAYRRAVASIPHRFGTIEYALATVMATACYERAADEISSRA